jgi:hypothetical protein
MQADAFALEMELPDLIFREGCIVYEKSWFEHDLNSCFREFWFQLKPFLWK